MKTEHTPAPWTIQHGETRRVYLINDKAGNAIGEIVYTDTRNPSDAQLIAAAPELLAALEWALRQIEDDLDPDHQAALEQAHAAIYKAIGA
jgi:hypothetical protein